MKHSEGEELRELIELRHRFLSKSVNNRTFSAFATTELKRRLGKLEKIRKKLFLKEIPSDEEDSSST